MFLKKTGKRTKRGFLFCLWSDTKSYRERHFQIRYGIWSPLVTRDRSSFLTSQLLVCLFWPLEISVHSTSQRRKQPAMSSLLLLAAYLLVVGAFRPQEEMKAQERLFLSSLGLSGRPRPAGNHHLRSQIPPAFWRMFRRSENLQVPEGDPCTVSEYGVRGNIIRYVQDQGRRTLWPGYVSCLVPERNNLMLELPRGHHRTFYWAVTLNTGISDVKI